VVLLFNESVTPWKKSEIVRSLARSAGSHYEYAVVRQNATRCCGEREFHHGSNDHEKRVLRGGRRGEEANRARRACLVKFNSRVTVVPERLESSLAIGHEDNASVVNRSATEDSVRAGGLTPATPNQLRRRPSSQRRSRRAECAANHPSITTAVALSVHAGTIFQSGLFVYR